MDAFGRDNGWRAVTLFTALFVAAPLSVIFLSHLRPEPEIWQHMADNLLVELVINTVVLAGGVVILTGILGVGLAWLTAVCDFPGRRVFDWALLLPLAMPAYVLAFVFLGVFDFSGPLQHLAGRIWPSAAHAWPDIRGAGGIIVVLALALYPYIYLLARNAFLTQGRRALEAAQSLGVSRRRAFFRVALPMARPWIAGGLVLVLMETLADFGAVSVFNYNTFTMAIYEAWFGFFSLDAAAQLSSILVLIVLAVLTLEQHARQGQRYTQSGKTSPETLRIRLSGGQRIAAFLFSGSVLAMGFIIPFIQLGIWSVQVFEEEFRRGYLDLLGHSLFLSGAAALAVIGLSLILAYAGRQHPDRFTRLLIRLSVMGYAIPGTVLAVGMVIVIAFMDNVAVSWAERLFGRSPAPFIQGTVIVMIAAYLVRFMAAGYNALHSAMHRIPPSIDEAARTLGVKGLSLLRRVHIPILRGGLLTAAILVFVDVMKEMPITLMTRPFGWDTLAVKIFELTAEGEWQRAALPAVGLVLGGLIPVVLLTRHTRGEG